MRNEFGTLVDLVDMADFVEEGEDPDEVLFEATKSPEKYKAFKARVYENMENSDVLDVDQLAFLKNAAPEPLRPIIVQVQSGSDGGGFGAVGGILFTLWLLSNMS